MESRKTNYKFYTIIKNLLLVFSIAFFLNNNTFANQTDKREYNKSCKHWIEDGPKIELLLQNGQPIKIFTDNFVKKNKNIKLIFNEVEKKNKYILGLDNNLKCVFTEYSLEEIKDIRFDLVMYDLCKLLGFGNVPPIVWRDDLVIDGKKHRGTLQLYFEKMDLEGYDDEDLRRSMLGISQQELDEYRVFNLLMGTWNTSLENLSICGGGYLVHDDASGMKLRQVFEKYGEVPFVLFHEFVDAQVSNSIKEYEKALKQNEEFYEQEKLKAKQERHKMRVELQKQKVEEEKKLQQMKTAFQQQREAYLKQQKEILRQQEEFRKQQEEMMKRQQALQSQNFPYSQQQNYGQNQINNQQQNYYPYQQNYAPVLPQNVPQQEIYDPYQNMPEPTNPQLDYIEQQIQFLDEQDALADVKYEPFPFYTVLHINENERYKIAGYYSYNPPHFDHNYIIWKRNYWLQVSDPKVQNEIKYVLFPKLLTSTMKEKIENFKRVRVLEFFLKNRYYRMQEDQIQEYITKCIPYVDAIMERCQMLLDEFKRRELEENQSSN